MSKGKKAPASDSLDDQLAKGPGNPSHADILKGARRTQVRDRLQAAAEKQIEDHKKELFRRRVDLARAGVRNYSLKKIPEAVKAFHSYLGVLEDWKEVGEGGLHPGLFDREKDMSELLLISGVYWDLMKLYDRTKSPERYQDFLHYTQKFVDFTFGLPFQSLAAETLRKYMVTGKPVHKKEFESTYKRLANTKCFIATALVLQTEPDTLPVLRSYRDQILLSHSFGRFCVKVYETVSPRIVPLIEVSPVAIKKLLGMLLDSFANLVRNLT